MQSGNECNQTEIDVICNCFDVMNLLLSRLVLHFKVKCTCSKTTGVNTNK